MNYYNKTIAKAYPLYESESGNYFIGETPIIGGQTKHGISMLKNPCDSKVNIYVNAITLTNISPCNLSAEFFLRSDSFDGKNSDLISCVNTTICPEPRPEGEIQYLCEANCPPSNGVAIFSRIVSPYTTLVVDGGQIILGPGQNLSVYIGGFMPVTFNGIKFAFGWWEEKIQPCYYD